jgi:hypothetical protein
MADPPADMSVGCYAENPSLEITDGMVDWRPI